MSEYEETIVVSNRGGLHVRPLLAFYSSAQGYTSKWGRVTLCSGADFSYRVDAGNTISLMSLNVPVGGQVRIVVSGRRAEKVGPALTKRLSKILSLDDSSSQIDN